MHRKIVTSGGGGLSMNNIVIGGSALTAQQHTTVLGKRPAVKDECENTVAFSGRKRERLVHLSADEKIYRRFGQFIASTNVVHRLRL